MKTRTAPTVILFFAIVAAVCFGAWQAYAWATSDKTEVEVATTTAPVTTTTVVSTTAASTTTTVITAEQVAEAEAAVAIYCPAFYDAYYEYGKRVANYEDPEERVEFETECLVELPPLIVGTELVADLDTYCEGWDIGQETAPDYFGPGTPTPCPQPVGGPPPVDR